MGEWRGKRVTGHVDDEAIKQRRERRGRKDQQMEEIDEGWNVRGCELIHPIGLHG